MKSSLHTQISSKGLQEQEMGVLLADPNKAKRVNKRTKGIYKELDRRFGKFE